MKKYLILLLAFLSSLSIQAEVTVTIEPSDPLLGETAQLKINSTEGTPRLSTIAQVEGINWQNSNGSSSRTTIINGKQTTESSITLAFTVSKLGKLTIPPLTFTIDGKQHTSKPITFTVQKQKSTDNLSLKDKYFAEVYFADRKASEGTIYVGEEITLVLRTYILKSIFGGWTESYPKSEISNLLFHDYSAENRKNSKFAKATGGDKTVDGARFQVINYVSKIQALKPGKVKATFTITHPLKDNSNPVRDFFGRVRYNSRPSTIDVALPKLTALPLPARSSKQGQFLSLVGNWDVKLSSTVKKVKAGDTFSLKMSIVGQGDINALSVPELELPGFRTMKPEVKKEVGVQTSKATVEWVLIPNGKAKTLPELVFSTFSPQKKKYISTHFKLDTTVTIPDGFVARPQLKRDKKPKEKKDNTDIRRLKTNLGGALTPLNPNSISLTTLILFILGPALWIIAILISRRREKFSDSDEYRRRHQAQKRKATVIKKLKQAAESDRIAIISEEVIPLLNDLAGLAPGTSGKELAEHLNDDELKAILEQVEMSNFMPTAGSSIKIDSIIKSISKLGIFLVVFSCLNLFAAGSPETDAQDQYDKGNYQEAFNQYTEIIQDVEKQHPGETNADLIYNLGNCQYQLGNLGKALVLYERAYQLNPRDADIYWNLTFTRNQLDLPKKYNTTSPSGNILKFRDNLKSDEWFRIAAVIILLFFIYLASCRLRQTKMLIPALLFTIILCSLAIGAGVWQLYSPGFSKDQAYVISHKAPVYQLAKEEDDIEKFTLLEGAKVTITERRKTWSWIKSDKGDGWIKNETIETP